MKSKHIRKVLLLVAITILLVGLASAAITNKTNTNKDTKIIKDNTKTIKSTPVATKKASTQTVTNNKTQKNNKVKEKTSEKTTQKIEKNKQKNTKTESITIEDWESLNNTIEQVTGDTTIKLENDLDVTTETITLNKQGITVTIDGNGQTINGKQKQVFLIEQGSTLHLKNITITNATTTGTDADACAFGGAIYNNGTLTITQSSLTNNQATATGKYAEARGGAIYNSGTLTINNSTLQNNTATRSGGAIHFVVYKNEHSININNSKFIENHASIGAAIRSDRNDGGTIYITNNHFSKNTADNKETIDMVGQGTIVDNTYDSTDIALKTVNLTLKDERESFDYNDEVVLNIKVELENPGHYDQDILEKINKTFYINGIENITTAGENYTYSNLKLGEYTVYYKTCNQESNTVTFRVTFIISNWQELRDAVSYATGETEDMTLTLEDGTYTNTGTIEWNNPNMVLTIDGNGQTIDGNQQRVFYIDSGSSLVLKNITIKNAKSDFGGAIYNYGRLTITQSTLTENKATNNGGAIYNDRGNLIITQSAFTGNTAFSGGAILNGGKLIITQSTFTDNTGTDWGGAIRLSSFGNAVISDCNFTSNTASEGAAIHTYGYVNLTGNIFTENKATSNKETIDLYGQGTGEFDGNVYNSTDISLDEISLIIKDDKNIITITDNITLNYTIRPSNSNYYYDFEEGISDIILYINGEKNITTKYESTTLTNLEAGEYEVYFTSCNQQSNTVTFTVKYDSDITTPLDSYEYYPGINTKIPFNITDPSGAKGSIELDVYEDGVGYKSLSVYPNVGDEYILSTETIVQLLENMYGNLDSSYVIGAYYVSNYRYTNPKLTNFSLNIIKQRNTSIIYNIINNTEGNVQINITVIDAITKTPIPATIQITGAINKNTETGIITDETLKSGDYIITVNYEKTPQYLNSTATINFKVEIDKDKKIEELEQTITQQQLTIKEEQQKVETLNKTVETQKQDIKELEEKVEKLTEKTKTQLTISKATATVGKKVTIKVTVKDANGKAVTGGKVSLKVNGKVLKDSNNNIIYADVSKGVASIKYLVPGSWITKNPKIQAIYTGNDKYNDSTVTKTKLVNVNKGSTTITLTPNIKSTKAGSKVTITVKHIDTNTKQGLTSKVAVKVNGKAYKVKVKKGEGKLTYTVPKGMNAKTVKVTASHSSKYYNKATGKTTFKVTKTTPTIKTTKTTYKSKKSTIKGKILDANNKVLTKNVKVTVKVDGKVVLKNKVVKKGKINLSFKKSLKKGYHELTITSKATKAFDKGKLTTVLKI